MRQDPRAQDKDEHPLVELFSKQTCLMQITSVLFVLLCFYVFLLFLVAYLMHAFPFDTPASTWSQLDCDHLAMTMDHLKHSPTIPEFHQDCLHFLKKTYPVCEAAAPDSRFTQWKQSNGTHVFKDRYNLLFPFPTSTGFLKDGTRFVLPLNALSQTEPRVDICYFGTYPLLLSALETQYEIDSHYTSKEVHIHVPQEGEGEGEGLRPPLTPPLPVLTVSIQPSYTKIINGSLVTVNISDETTTSLARREGVEEPVRHPLPLLQQLRPTELKYKKEERMVHVVFHFILDEEKQTRNYHVMDTLFGVAFVWALALGLLVYLDRQRCCIQCCRNPYHPKKTDARSYGYTAVPTQTYGYPYNQVENP